MTDEVQSLPQQNEAPTLKKPRQGPLRGIRVLDLSAYIAGPYACSLLADQGAEVIKIEPPEGDNLRKYPSSLPVESRAFLGVNRSKYGVVLDLKTEAGYAKFMSLVETADVLVHNFRPGVPERLKIDGATLNALNPQLIYCAITGYGETGPRKHHAGYDQVLQAMTGMCAMQGEGQGVPQILYGSVVDYYAAALLSAGVSSALYERAQSGLGQCVEVSLLRSALAMQSARLVWANGEGRDVPRDMRSGGVTGIHPTRAGYLYLSANTPHFWQALCQKLGLCERLYHERYDSIKKRAKYAHEILPHVHQALLAHTALEWEAIFGEAVPCAAIRTVEDMFEDPQVISEGMMARFEHPTLGSYQGFKEAIKFGRTPSDAPFAAPTLNQHASEIFGDDLTK